jgi:hypothetical protein
MAMRHRYDDDREARALRARPVPAAGLETSAAMALHLQSTAGNAAVAHSLGHGVQRLAWDDEPGAGVPDEPADGGIAPADQGLDAGVEEQLDGGADAGEQTTGGSFESSSSAPGGSSESSGSGGAGGSGGGAAAGPEKVEVGSTHIGGILSGAPIWHLFLIHTDAGGTQTGYRGGPGGPGGPKGSSFGTIRTRTGAYGAGFVDYPAVDKVTVATGPAAAGKDATFAAELPRIDATATPYAPTGPNSNTVASTLLHKAGLPHTKPVTIAPGFDDPDL